MKKPFVLLFTWMLSYACLGQQEILDGYVTRNGMDSITIENYLSQSENYILSFCNYWNVCEETTCNLDNQGHYLEEKYNYRHLLIGDQVSDRTFEESLLILPGLSFDKYILTTFDEVLADQELPLHLFISKGKKVDYSLSGQISAGQVDAICEELGWNSRPQYFDSSILECITISPDCDQELLGYTSDVLALSSQLYFEYTLDNQAHLIGYDSISNVMLYLESETNEAHVLYPFGKRVCDSINLYDTQRKQNRVAQITEYYCADEIEYWVTDLEMECTNTFFTIRSDYGSNAGLIPIYSDSKVASLLECRFENEELVYSRVDKCNPEKPQLLNQLKIYPNPVTSEMIIDAGLRQASIADLRDVKGRALPFDSLDGNVFDVSHLPGGIYFLGVEIEGFTQYHKIIKE